ncbi:PilW family protein [Gulbenkiania mobilis]|uniref:Prepilin-type N-terminal cleavage/methylation domain-containing protein n=1 Tax=Gulbenkiania mobilis TaxID=397457 RepID=A0ABY2D0G5_GULMO|nr:PilW family protein [Gulbenkiania mobilis]TCW31959.1 prepilin-type N-terminal cleavage/methylation domain-containing protein [Gulbenkiania mobilis]
MRQYAYRQRQSGLTLVELMVALVIGLIVVAATAVVFSRSSAIGRNQDQNALMQENARYVFTVLDRALRQAAYTPSNAPLASAPVTVSNLNAYSDTLTVRYAVGAVAASGGAVQASMQDCSGETAPAGSVITNTFRVAVSNQQRRLVCESSLVPASTTDPIVIAENVEAFRVMVGRARGQVDLSDVDPSLCTLSAYQTTAASPTLTTPVVALKVGLVLRSDDVIPAAYRNAPTTFAPFGTTASGVVQLTTANLAPASGSYDARYLRRVYNTVFHLRNLCWR